MTALQSEHVIGSLRRQLSDAHLKIAMLEAELLQAGVIHPQVQSLLVVPDDPNGAAGEAANGGVE